MWKGDKGDEGLCCWLPAPSTVCAGESFQQSRYNPNTEPPGTEYRNAVGAKNCGGCSEIEGNYNVISEEMYNALRAGGNCTAIGSLNEPGWSGGSCSMSESSSGVIASGNCGASVTISKQTCFSSYNFNIAFIGFSYQISKVGTEYRFAYGFGSQFGSAYCPFGINSYTCYSVGYNVSWELDNYPGGLFCPIAGGGITLNTSAGTLGPFGIHTFCGFGSNGFMNITITPF